MRGINGARAIPVLRDGARTTGTLTWWRHGWQTYALRLEGPFGMVEAVEDTWFDALAAVREQMAGWTLDLPESLPEIAEEHRLQWLTWLDAHAPG
ncbi:hypothetical protein ACTG9Q_06560 [Actinokineospora sp. 24-640]